MLLANKQGDHQIKLLDEIASALASPIRLELGPNVVVIKIVVPCVLY